MYFRDRRHAGRLLGLELKQVNYGTQFTVLGLPRGGIPVAFEVAKAINAKLDTFTVRKLGVPNYEELSMGAIGPGDATILNHEVIHAYQVSEDELRRIKNQEVKELRRRLQKYRAGNANFALKGRDLLVVDDGLATGATMKVACQALRTFEPRSIHVAVPIGAQATCTELETITDRVVCLESPTSFFGIGQFYKDFRQTSDQEVVDLLSEAKDLPANDTSDSAK